MRFIIQLKTDRDIDDFSMRTLKRYGIDVNSNRRIVTGLCEDFDSVVDLRDKMLPYDTRWPIISQIASDIITGNYKYF